MQASALREQQGIRPAVSPQKSLHLSGFSKATLGKLLTTYITQCKLQHWESSKASAQLSLPRKVFTCQGFQRQHWGNCWQLTLPNASFSTERAARHPPSCLSPEKSSPVRVFKGNTGETSESGGGAHMGFSKRIDNTLNWTEPNRVFSNSKPWLKLTSLSACLSTATVCCCEALAPLSLSREFFSLSRSVNIMRSSPFSWLCTGNGSS